MNESLTLGRSVAKPSVLGGGLDRVARRVLLAQLRGLPEGTLEVLEGGSRETLGGRAPGPAVTLRVRHPRFWTRVLLGGTLGAGESYMDGEWEADDLSQLARLMVRNADTMLRLDGGLTRVKGLANEIEYRLRSNTRSGARRNIAEHYDLGNDFFALFLDPTMMYSCAFFETPESTLEEASVAKLDRICQKLELRAGESLVEIGSGWGGFAIHAARNYGVRVTTTTISRRQHEWATRAVAEAGLSDRVTVLLEDYRDLAGQYDKLVSIEMIEAVGHEHLETYFATISRLLKPEGRALLQAITLPDGQYDRARKEVDFIKKHIFPGSFIPSVTRIVEASTRASDLRLVDLEDIGLHYATTLRHWRERFLGRIDEVRAQGFDEPFIRGWEFYLATCEGSFAERNNSNVHAVFHKPRAAGAVPRA